MKFQYGCLQKMTNVFVKGIHCLERRNQYKKLGNADKIFIFIWFIKCVLALVGKSVDLCSSFICVEKNEENYTKGNPSFLLLLCYVTSRFQRAWVSNVWSGCTVLKLESP